MIISSRAVFPPGTACKSLELRPNQAQCARTAAANAHCRFCKEDIISTRQVFKTLLLPSVKLLRALRMEVLMLPLKAANRFKRSSFLRGGGPVVSLTTYGKRIGTVYLTIESIARGYTLPSRVILWLDEESVFDNLPVSLQNLRKRGLEIKLCKNYGPHKKYYPYVEYVGIIRSAFSYRG